MSHFRVLVTGSSGQLGSELKLLADSLMPNAVFFFTDFEELDVTNLQQIKKFVLRNRVNAIINCAAYTAVDKAESDQEKAHLVNALAPQYLAMVAKEFNCRLIHISTDYVFDGRNYKPYVETDMPNPQSVYGKTKLEGERLIKQVNPENTIIIRTSWVYSRFGQNFVKTMLKLGAERESINVIYDQVGSPTNANDLAEVILKILPNIESKEVDLFHYTNEGVCSWYDFALAIFEIKGLNCNVLPIKSTEFQTMAIRPHYTVLDKSKIKNQFNLNSINWRKSLIEVFN